MQSSDKKIMAEYFQRIGNEQLSSDEKENLRSFIRDSFQDSQLDEWMENHWESLKTNGISEKDLYFNGLRENIWKRISQTSPTSNSNSKWIVSLSRIAAVLFIPLLLLSVYLIFVRPTNIGTSQALVMQQVFASPGSRTHLFLPDSSEVWLNSGSTLEYPVNMNRQKQRRVKLTGQGYFEVSHDEKHPFFVETGRLDIRVLGTSFDVSTYANDQFINSTLENGSIALLNPSGKEVARLVPGQKAILDKENNQLIIKDVDTRLITSWKDGRLVFKNTPLTDVTRQLERWFNCKISVSPGLLKSGILYTATIKDETLGEVLKMIEISTSVKTKIQDREITIME